MGLVGYIPLSLILASIIAYRQRWTNGHSFSVPVNVFLGVNGRGWAWQWDFNEMWLYLAVWELKINNSSIIQYTHRVNIHHSRIEMHGNPFEARCTILEASPASIAALHANLLASGQPTPVDTPSNLSCSNGLDTVPLCPHNSSTTTTFREFVKGKDRYPIHQIHQPPPFYTTCGRS